MPHPPQLSRGGLAGHMVPRRAARQPDGVSDMLQSALAAPARFVQLLDQGQEDVQLADVAQTFRHLAKPALELAGRVLAELEHRQQLPEPAGRDPCGVDGVHVPFLDPR
jgi:hypothetical protein